MTTEEENIFNNTADFWINDVGANPLPVDTRKKKISVSWKEDQDKSIPIELHEYRKRNGDYNNGLAVMTGKIHKGKNEGKYLIGIDCDNLKALEEILTRDGKKITLQELANWTRVEQHKDDLNKAHIFILSTKSFKNKGRDPKFPELAIEIKCDHLTIFTAPSIHQNGYPYEVLGVKEPILCDDFEIHLDNIFKKFNIEYLEQNNNNISKLPDELRKLVHLLEIPKDFQFRINEGSRHTTMVSFANGLLFGYRFNTNVNNDLLKTFFYEVNDKICVPPSPENEIQQIWKDAMEFVAENINNDYAAATATAAEGGDNTTEENYSDNKNNKNNNKTVILKQLKPEIQEQLSKHTWEIIQYSPLKFVIAHSDYKQIMYAEIKKHSVLTKKDNNKDTIETSKTTISFLNLSRIVIGAIPEEVILNKNPLGLFEHKYTIKFVTRSNDSFTIGPKTLDEITTYLKDRSLVYMSTKTTEVLSIMISAFERNGQLITKHDIDTPGFYFIDGKIRYYNVNNTINNAHPKPTLDQIKSCCELLDILQPKFNNKDVFPTVVKWSVIAPFDYVIKQIHKKWIPWLYPYGWSNTGKSTLGEKICCCVWNRYDNENSIIPFTAVDTVARFGEALSKSTYPVVINEVGQLNDEHKNKGLVEMFKTAITDRIARKKYVNKTIWTEIPSFSACILTGNSTPPKDTGFRRRIIPIVFTEKDQYSKDAIIEFEKLFDERIKHELRYLGDFTVNYIMEHQQELLIESKKDWKEIAEIVLTEFYKSIRKEAPEWIKNFVQETQLEDSKEDADLLFRSFLINKVNETYNKFHRNIESVELKEDIPFESRLAFCLYNNLIPFLNPIKVKDGTNLIAITSDLINELKQKIPEISSLPEISSIIEGFEYGQKRIGGKNAKTVYGTVNQLLDFLGLRLRLEKENE